MDPAPLNPDGPDPPVLDYATPDPRQDPFRPEPLTLKPAGKAVWTFAASAITMSAFCDFARSHPLLGIHLGSYNADDFAQTLAPFDFMFVGWATLVIAVFMADRLRAKGAQFIAPSVRRSAIVGVIYALAWLLRRLPINEITQPPSDIVISLSFLFAPVVPIVLMQARLTRKGP